MLSLTRQPFYQTAALCAAVLIFGFMSFPASAQNNDMRAVMNRLNQIENQVQTISKSVYRDGVATGGIQTATPSYDGSLSEGGNVAAMLSRRLAEIEEEMRTLNGRVEEQNFTINQLREQNDLMKSDMELRLNALEGNAIGGNAMPAPVTSPAPLSSLNTTMPNDNGMAETSYNDYVENTPASPATSSNPPSGDFSFDSPSTLYDQAFQAVRGQDFARAEQGFKEFLQRYPDHKLAGNAKYWLGETYYVRGSFDDAIKTFAEGYQQYPQGNKAPDNLLKLGVTLAQKGRIPDACVALNQLKTNFPSAAPAIKSRADKELERLSCE